MRRLVVLISLGLAGANANANANAGATLAAPAADGQAEYESGHYAVARGIWEEQAASGDRDAALGLGLLYDLGQGVTQDFSAALHWYEAAGELGLPQAELNAAVMEDSGRAGPRDAAAAALWYARAAAHGDHRAEYDMGQLYAAGDGVPRNPALAAAWFGLAAAGGLTAAAERVAALHPASPAGAATSASPVPLVPAAPVDGATVRRDDADRAVELVWIAPPQPEPARSYVEVVALGDSNARPTFAGYAPASSLLVRLPGAGRYAWRVYAVSAPSHAYVPSAWQRFTLYTTAPDHARLARATAE